MAGLDDFATLQGVDQAIQNGAAAMGDRANETRAVRRPAMDRRWSSAIGGHQIAQHPLDVLS